MKKKQGAVKKEGYTLDEVRTLTDKFIDASAERLRNRLREAWKKQDTIRKSSRYGVTV